MAGRVDIRRAVDLARLLGEFTRNEFADGLGVSALEAGKWLRRLQEEKDTIRREGAKYVFDDPEKREAPPGPPYEGWDARVVARKLKRFTRIELRDAMGISDGTSSDRINWLLELRVIRDSGKRGWTPRGPNPAIYEVVPVEKSSARIKRKSVEVEMREKGMLGAPASRNGFHEKRIKAQKSSIQPIIDAAYDAGATIRESGKHYVITLPGGAKLTVAKTPGTDKPKKEYAEARRLGLNV